MWKLRKAWPQEQASMERSLHHAFVEDSPPQDGPHWKLHSQAYDRRMSLWKGFTQTAPSILIDGPGCYSKAQQVGLLCLLQEDEP